MNAFLAGALDWVIITEVEVIMEIKDSKKHAFKGVIVFLYQFNNQS